MQRLCTGCNITKPLTDFVKDKYDKSGYTYRCKKCRAKNHKEWVLKNPEKVKEINLKNKDKRKQFYNSPEGRRSSRRSWLKKTYGLSLEDYDKMLKEQNNLCAICEEKDTKDKWGCLAVDHDHKTGKIRDLLCYKCNAGIGLLNDNKELLIKAIKYLEKHESITIS